MNKQMYDAMVACRCPEQFEPLLQAIQDNIDLSDDQRQSLREALDKGLSREAGRYADMAE